MPSPVTRLVQILEDHATIENLNTWVWDALELARSAAGTVRGAEAEQDCLECALVDLRNERDDHIRQGARLAQAVQRLAIHDGACRDCGVRPDTNTHHAHTCEAARLVGWDREPA